jgi:hypothetical protein
MDQKIVTPLVFTIAVPDKYVPLIEGDVLVPTREFRDARLAVQRAGVFIGWARWELTEEECEDLARLEVSSCLGRAQQEYLGSLILRAWLQNPRADRTTFL